MRHSAIFLTFAGLALFAPCGLASAQAPAAGAAPGAETYPSLPPGENRDLMIKTCSDCHSPAKVDNVRGTLQDFQNLIARMQDNGLTASPEDIDKIAHYLAASFPPSLPKPHT